MILGHVSCFLFYTQGSKVGERGGDCMHSSISMDLMILDGCKCLAGFKTKHVAKSVWLIKCKKDRIIPLMPRNFSCGLNHCTGKG